MGLFGTDPLLFGHRWTCHDAIQTPNTTLLPPGPTTDNLRQVIRNSTTIPEQLIRDLTHPRLTPLHVIQVDGQFHQPTPIIHDISTTQGRTDNQILSGSREHNFARRDFELILDVPYLDPATHILTTLKTEPLQLPPTTNNAVSNVLF